MNFASIFILFFSMVTFFHTPGCKSQEIKQNTSLSIRNIRYMFNDGSLKPIHDAVENGGTVQNIWELIQRGENVNNTDDLGWSPLQLASFHGLVEIANFLIQNGAYVNYANESGQTALHWSAGQGHEQIVLLLIKHGSNINPVNSNGRTPLHEAILFGREKVVRVLLQFGAKRHIKDNHGNYPIDLQMNNKIIEDLLLNRTAKEACIKYSNLLDEFAEAYSLNDRIIGGKLVEPGEFQWMVSLGYGKPTTGYTFYCAGTIISEYFVLTAGHCAAAAYRNSEVVRAPPTVIRYGKLSRKDDDGVKAQFRDIKEIIQHPEYSPVRYWKNDIALLRLEKAILFTEDIRPACLDTDIRDKSPNTNLLVAGWGSISVYEFVRSYDLRKTQVVTMPLAQCKTVMKQYGIDDSHYCAHDPDRRNDSCQGDSGGPLQTTVSNDNDAKAIGIVSFGVGCASGFPGVYTRIAYYLDWIESFVWPFGLITTPQYIIE